MRVVGTALAERNASRAAEFENKSLLQPERSILVGDFVDEWKSRRFFFFHRAAAQMHQWTDEAGRGGWLHNRRGRKWFKERSEAEAVQKTRS